jgi:type II secretory pathway component PulM
MEMLVWYLFLFCVIIYYYFKIEQPNKAVKDAAHAQLEEQKQAIAILKKQLTNQVFKFGE